MNIVTNFLFPKIFHIKNRLKFSEDSGIIPKLIIILIE